MNKLLSQEALKSFELKLFLDVLCEVYGIDFKNYASASLSRRLESLLKQEKKESLSELIPLLINEKNFNELVLKYVTIQHSNLFRDPLFFKKLKKLVFPALKHLPNIKIWIAGCANGEEVYTLLILLKEAKLLDKTQIYATDISQEALANVKSGVLKKGIKKEDIDNYNKSGGKYSLSNYFTLAYSKFKLKEELLSHVTFMEHNLAHDKAFITTQLILCRNVMIYFNQALHEKVLELFNESLITNGYLGIGIDETLEFTQAAKGYEELTKDVSIYKKEF